MTVLEDKIQSMRNYWLKVLPESELLLLETEWFSNDQDSELLEISRNDLIDDYLANNLSKSERQDFEKSFLINNLDEVAFNQISVEISKNNQITPNNISKFNTFFVNFWSYIKLPQIAFATSIILLICLGISYKFYNSEPTQIAQQDIVNQNILPDNSNEIEQKVLTYSNKKADANLKNTEITEKKAKNENAQSVIPKAEKNINKTEKQVENKDIETESVKTKSPQVLLLTSFRGGVKSLKLSETGKTFDIQLEMPGIDKAYQSYEIRVYDANQNLVLQQKVNENLTLKKSGQRIIVKGVNTAKFKKNNTYRTSLMGIDEKKETKELNLYDSFKID